MWFSDNFVLRPITTNRAQRLCSLPVYIKFQEDMARSRWNGRQSYVEDCEVCCNPIEVSYTVQDDALASFDAKTLE